MDEKIKNYFKRYPHSNEVFEKGGLLFHNKGAAESYPKGELKKHIREQVEISGSRSPVDDEDSKKLQKEQLKKEAIDILKTADDIVALDYNLMKKIVKDLELSPADIKKETLITTLTEYKTTIKTD